MISGLTFSAPQWLWVTAGCAVLFAVLYGVSARIRHRQLAEFAEPELLARLLASHSRTRRAIKNTLLLLSAVFLGLALARPQLGEIVETQEHSGEDVLFLLDTSKSMLAADVQPTRLERAKLAIREFAHQHARGRVGLVAFAGSAFLQCPLTLDYDAFDESVREVDTESVPLLGTDIARALFESRKAFEKDDHRKMIVLVTDGEDLENGGVKAAQTAAKEGVIVFTIGVGTAAGAPVMIPQPGGTSVPLLDASGQPVTSALDEKTLQEIALAAGGSYRSLQNIGGGLSDITSLLQGDTKQAGTGRVKRYGIDRYQWPLTVAILALVVESFLGTHRRHRRTRKPGQPATSPA